MLVKANIGSPVEKKTSKAGKAYALFRAAENYGKDENRTTTWYKVMAFIPEEQQDMLGKGDYVEIEGKLLEPEVYQKKDGSGVAVQLTIMAHRVEPAQRGGGNGGGNRSNAAGNGSYDDGARPPSDRPVYEHSEDDIPF